MRKYHMNVSLMKLIEKYFKSTFYWRPKDGTRLFKFFACFTAFHTALGMSAR